MAITIIDSFDVRHSGPVDARIVASSSTDRLAITWLYDGLKVFQLSDRTNWTWNDGTSTWDQDTAGTISGVGRSPYIPYWSSSSVLGNSPMLATESNTNIQIQKYLYFGDANNLHNYDLSIGSSLDGWLTLSTKSNFNGIRFVNGSLVSDSINFGPVTHEFAADTNGTYIILKNSSYTAGLTLDNNSNLAVVSNANLYNYSIFGSVDLIAVGLFVGSASSLSVYPGGAYINTNILSLSASITYASHQFATLESVYQNISTHALSGGSYNITAQDHNLLFTNSGSSATINLPSANTQNGRLITIQAGTASSNLVVTPGVGNSLYYNGTFNPNLSLIRGDSVEMIAYGGVWYSMVNLTDESWKRVGAGGTFKGGQSVPAYNAGTVYDPVQNVPFDNGSGQAFKDPELGAGLFIRKTKYDDVEIRGTFQADSGITNGTIITLPTGYRPTQQVALYANVYLSNGGVSSIPLIHPITIYIRTNGNMRFAFNTSGVPAYDRVTFYVNGRFSTIA